jgi:hypothetical protein
MTAPRYLRFARSLALVSGLGCASFGCGMAVSASEDTGAVAGDAGSDAAFDCTACECGLTATDAGVPLCSGDAILACHCAAVGPLAPPDLA